jgi:hypothetical protein
MRAAFTRHIIVANGDLSHLGWLVTALRDAGHVVFPVTDGEGVLRIAEMLSQVDVLIASRETPTLCGRPFDEFIHDRLANVKAVYWDPNMRASPGELTQLLSH